MPNLLVIPGSLRAASSSKATARSIEIRLKDRANLTIADIGKLPHYSADIENDPAVAEFVGQLNDADGVVFITPEYNYSMPGVLKNAIDWGSRPAFAAPFTGKPCFIISVSGGALGGVRAQSHLKYVLGGMLARVHVSKEIVVTHANSKVADGFLQDDVILDFAEKELVSFLASLT